MITSSYVRIIWYNYILENVTWKIRLFWTKKKKLTSEIENPKKFSKLFETNASVCVVSVLVLCSERGGSGVTRWAVVTVWHRVRSRNAVCPLEEESTRQRRCSKCLSAPSRHVKPETDTTRSWRTLTCRTAAAQRQKLVLSVFMVPFDPFVHLWKEKRR